MRPDLIIKNRKLSRILGVAGIILSVIVIFLALRNLGWLYRLVGLCAISYYLVDIEQTLEESDALAKASRIALSIINIIYILISLICAFLNVDLLLRLFGIAGAGYLEFKSYQLVRNGIFNKKLKLSDGLVATSLGVFPAILLIAYTFWYFWLILLAFTLLYNLVHLIVRIKIERGPTNREL